MERGEARLEPTSVSPTGVIEYLPILSQCLLKGFVCCKNRINDSNRRVPLVRMDSQFREMLFREFVNRGRLDFVDKLL